MTGLQHQAFISESHHPGGAGQVLEISSPCTLAWASLILETSSGTGVSPNANGSAAGLL